MNTHDPDAGYGHPAGAALSARRKIRLREVDSAQARLARHLGTGLQAELALESGPVLRLEASGLRAAGLPSARRPLLLQAQAGTLALSPAREIVRALAAIDLPEDDGNPSLQAMRQDMALQAMPAAALSLFGASTFLAANAANALEGPDADELLELTLTLHRPQARLGMAATLRGTADALLQAFSRHQWQPLGEAGADDDEDELPLAVPVCLGTTELSVHALDALAPGDVVPLARPFFGLEGEGELPIAKGLARCVLHAGNRTQVEITEWHPTTAGFAMNDDNDDSDMRADTHDVTADDPLDDVSVTLRFELGSLELTLADLRSLAPGRVLDVAGAAPPLVAICAGRRRIGLGELVDLGGRLAVEVRRIGASS